MTSTELDAARLLLFNFLQCLEDVEVFTDADGFGFLLSLDLSLVAVIDSMEIPNRELGVAHLRTACFKGVTAMVDVDLVAGWQTISGLNLTEAISDLELPGVVFIYNAAASGEYPDVDAA